MIYLKSRNVIFIKPRKTAGTSVEIALSANASPDDIVTPITPEDERRRLAPPFQFPVNWATDVAFERDYYHRIRELDKRDGAAGTPIEVSGHARFFNHMPPETVESELGRACYAGAYKVSMVRHPYEQLVSQAYWRCSKMENTSFNEQVELLLNTPGFSNTHLYFDHQKRRMDFLIRYEQLREGLETLEKTFDLELLKYLPVTKQASRVNRKPAHQILSQEQKKRCFSNNRRVFEAFDYGKYF